MYSTLYIKTQFGPHREHIVTLSERSANDSYIETSVAYGRN